MNRRRAVVVLVGALVAIAGLVAPGAARAAPVPGRWEASGPGVRIDFVVTRDRGRLVAAHPVGFCGDYGEPLGEEDFRPDNLLGAGHAFGADSARIRRGKRFHIASAELSGALHRLTGTINWHGPGLDAPPEMGGASCHTAQYRHLRAHAVGPVRIEDGYWKLSGTLDSEGWLEVYGGGALVRFGGHYVGPPSPELPEAGPCLVDAGGVAAPWGAFSVPAPIGGSLFAGGVTVDVAGIVDKIDFEGQFTAPGWAYGTFDGVFNYAGEYTCGAAGFWIARHRRSVKFAHAPGHWPEPPPPGPHDFRCAQGDVHADPDAVCKTYTLATGQPVDLLWGNRRFGFRHIRRRHGFSAKADGLIAQTLTAAPDAQRNGTTNYERQFGSGASRCVVRVVVSPADGVHTAFVLGYADGRFSRCP